MSKEQKLMPKLRFKGFGLASSKELNQLVSFSSGGTPPKANPAYWKPEIPWISAASMRGNSYGDSPTWISMDGLKNGSREAIQGDILILVRGSMLWNCIPVGIAQRNVAFNQDVKALRSNKNITNKFLFQWFKSQEHRLLNKVVGTGIGAGKLDTDELKSLRIHLPTLPEQEKIAAFLSSVDARIEQLQRKKSLLQDYKKGVMQRLFSQQLRFKDKNGNNYPDWQEKKLGDYLLNFKLGGNYANSETPTNQPLIKMGNLGRGSIKLNKLEYIEDGEVINDTDRIKKGDLFFNTRNTLDLVGKVAIWRDELPKAYYNSNLMRIEFENNYFMNYWLNSYTGLKSLKRLATGTTSVAAIYTKDLLKIKLVVPSLPEQTEIANFLSTLDTKIEQVTQQITQTQTFKKGLLQQMFV